MHAYTYIIFGRICAKFLSFYDIFLVSIIVSNKYHLLGPMVFALNVNLG